MNRFAAAFILLSLLLGMISCSQTERTVRLRFRYIPGTETAYRTVMKGNVRMYRGQTPVTDQINEITIDSRSRIENVTPDSTATVRELYTYHYRTFNRLDSMLVDTTTPPDEFLIRLTPRGRMVAYNSMQTSNDGALALRSGQSDPSAVEFPDRELRAGEQWTQRCVVRAGEDSIRTTTTYTVMAFTHENGYDCVTISYSGATEIPYESEPTDSLQRSGRYNLNVSGVLYFAYNDGFLVSQRERRMIEGRGRQWQSGRPQQAVDTRVAIEYSIEVRLVQPPKPMSPLLSKNWP